MNFECHVEKIKRGGRWRDEQQLVTLGGGSGNSLDWEHYMADPA